MNLENKDYNTKRNKLVIPEYGRNIQRIVEKAIEEKNREKRNTLIHGVIGVMGQMQTHLRDSPELNHKLWDHLFIISDFKLDVDSPYPKPSKEDIIKKPTKLDYPNRDMKHKHYGILVQNLIRQAVDKEEGKEKEVFIINLANLMKKSYLMWNRNSVDDEDIFRDLKKLSDGKLDIPSFKLATFPKEQVNNHPKRYKSGGGKNYRGYKKRK